MAQLFDTEELDLVDEQISNIDISSILREITKWKTELGAYGEDAIKRDVLDTVEDLIVDNCY